MKKAVNCFKRIFFAKNIERPVEGGFESASRKPSVYSTNFCKQKLAVL